ncbi:MAG TPA: hypothetical protein VF063_02575 [Gaiellaceae bacterium]
MRSFTHPRVRAAALCLGLVLAAALSAHSTASPARPAAARIVVTLVFDGTPLGQQKKMVWVEGLGKRCFMGYTTVNTSSLGSSNSAQRAAVATGSRQRAVVPSSRKCNGSRRGSSTFDLVQRKIPGFDFEGWKAADCEPTAVRCSVYVAAGEQTAVTATWMPPS